MIDLTSELGRRAEARLQTELVIWLTTVAASGVPQPRPVWFLWDGSAVLIYSQPAAKKLAHIAQNPQVALHFNSTPDGDDIQVLLATATMSRTPRWCGTSPPTWASIARAWPTLARPRTA